MILYLDVKCEEGKSWSTMDHRGANSEKEVCWSGVGSGRAGGGGEKVSVEKKGKAWGRW